MLVSQDFRCNLLVLWPYDQHFMDISSSSSRCVSCIGRGRWHASLQLIWKIPTDTFTGAGKRTGCGGRSPVYLN